MAEPVSALPNATVPSTSPKGQAVPWPRAAEPLPASVDISGSSTEALPPVGERIRSGVQDAYEQVQSVASKLLQRSRERFRYMSEERPIQIVIGVALASLMAGAALRIWRSNHD